MRRGLSKLPSCTIPIGSTAAPFSSFSSGRGRGRGSPLNFVAPTSKPESTDPNSSSSSEQPPPQKHQPPPPTSQLPLGHGRGGASSNVGPSFSGYGRGSGSSSGYGRGSGQKSEQPAAPPTPPPPPRKLDEKIEEGNLPTGILSVFGGAGRGAPIRPSEVVQERPKPMENRHLRQPPKRTSPPPRGASPPSQKLSREEAIIKAKGILSKGEDQGGSPPVSDGAQRGRREGGGFMGGRGGGRGRGMYGRRGGRRGGRGGRGGDRDEEPPFAGLYLGDEADGEKAAQRLGPKMMNTLAEAFEDASLDFLPCPTHDAYLDAMDINFKIECEPEYLMGEFDQNPDIHDTPPIPLREALEKMKPFLMKYEGIESQEEWEEVIKETMEQRLPLMKEIVDYYSGPDRVTAKQQIAELERVGNTLPQNIPASVKRYTDRAILSLQSNPGWGFDKKYQFMDKLVREVSQQYK